MIISKQFKAFLERARNEEREALEERLRELQEKEQEKQEYIASQPF